MQGLHLTADLYQCGCNLSLLVEADALAELCRRHTLEAGLTLVDEKWFTFPEHQGQPGGVTGMLLLAESHLAVHTWPERRGVTLDVYVCNFCQDNSAKAERLATALIAAFQAGQCETHRILRGNADNAGLSDELVLEPLTGHAVFGYRSHARLVTRQTRCDQMLEIMETPQFGRVMRLDGRFMTSEREEFFYHEALVHPAAIAHPAPRRGLIIGGGDGGAAEELIKHPSIERVVIAELDAEVIEAAKHHLAAVHRGVFDHPKLEIRIGDGFAYLEATQDRFDLVLFDLTDPDTPAASLYTAASFAKARRVLDAGGALVLHIGSPIFHPERVRQIVAELRQVFPHVHCYGLYIPLYGAYWGLAVASNGLDPSALEAATVAQRLGERGIRDLQYYNAAVHGALFALPNFYRELV
ncbi:MAG: polyamine aminopropyltransferase [Rhodocyclaceae bacterium]